MSSAQMSPLDAAFHDWADAHEGETECFPCFAVGWEARAGHDLDAHQAAVEQAATFWRHRVASVEAERDRAMMQLSSAEYERAAFRQQRDELARAFMEAKRQAVPTEVS